MQNHPEIQCVKPQSPDEPLNLKVKDWQWMSDRIFTNVESIQDLRRHCHILKVQVLFLTVAFGCLFGYVYLKQSGPVVIHLEKPLPNPTPLLPALPQSN